MRAVVLTKDLEDVFWNVVTKDFFDYYFFIYDWLLQRDKTKVLMAFEEDALLGLMLIYDESVVQLRGEPAAVEFLLHNLVLEKIVVQAPENCESVVLRKFPNFTLKEKILLMNVAKGEEHLNSVVKPEVLSSADAEAVALLMNECYPEMWSDITVKDVECRLPSEGSLWLGIRQQGKLVSFGYAMLTAKISHVTWIATHPQWRNKGYATSIVSALLGECLKKAPSAIIYAAENNLAAKTVYLKVGFKPNKSYILIKI
jgi:predicted GNAT family acetyltransferase